MIDLMVIKLWRKLMVSTYLMLKMEPKLRYTAVEKGDINLIDAYSTDAELKQYNMVVLKMINTYSHHIKVHQCLKKNS